MLLTCLLAFCFEAWTGNQELALNQIYTGVNLIREWKTKTANSSTSPSSMSPAEDELSRVFSGLAIQFITFTTAALLPAWDCLGKDGREHLPQMPANFVSLREAGMYEHIIMRYGMQLVVDKIVKPVLQSKEKLFPHGITSKEELRKGATEFDIVLGHIKQWWKAFEELSKVLYGKGGNIMVSAIILNLHITTLYLVLVGISGGDETAYDDYYELFGKTVELAEIVLKAEVEKSTGFYFSVGVVVSLQFTAQKCRCTSIRRKAIALLLGTARREGVWDSLLFGKMMEWGADVEEQFMKNGQVPGWARIPGIKRNADLRQRTATLICQQRKSELSDEMVTRRKVIHW
jgi:hypothetical protein